MKRFGVYLYGLATVAAGILDLVWGDFDPSHQPIQAFGDHIPGRTIFAYITAFWMIAGGVAILWRRSARLRVVGNPGFDVVANRPYRSLDIWTLLCRLWLGAFDRHQRQYRLCSHVDAAGKRVLGDRNRNLLCPRRPGHTLGNFGRSRAEAPRADAPRL